MSNKRKTAENAGGTRGKNNPTAAPADSPSPADNDPQPEAAEAPSAERMAEDALTTYSSAKDLVYAECMGELVFIPLKDAVVAASRSVALSRAKTWGEFRRCVTPESWRQMLEALREDGATDFPTFCASLVAECPWTSRREAQELYLRKKVGERLPTDVDPFEWKHLPFRTKIEVEEGRPFECRMIHWVPQSIQAKFGRVECYRIAGEVLEFGPAQEAEIVSAFESLGYTCLKAPWLVYVAHGHDVLSDSVKPPDPS
jgi:hypothetical protein